MFSNKLVVAIKNNGKVLREQKDQVFLPFGTEYSIFIKNLNSVRALVKIELDGKSVTDGEDLVVYGNNEIDLERFLKKGNLNQGNRFKFIERIAEVEAARGGIQAEDGLLRVSFQFEKVQPAPIHVPVIYDYFPKCYPSWPYHNPNVFYNMGTPLCQGIIGGNAMGIGSTDGVSYTATASNAALGGSGTLSANVNTMSVNVGAAACEASAHTMTNSNVGQGVLRSATAGDRSRTLSKKSSLNIPNVEVNDAGITAPGSVSDQKFQTASWFPVETETHVIVLKLLGETNSGKVQKVVTTKTKQQCPTCKTRNRGQNNFCRKCGSALQLVGSSSQWVAVR